MQRHPFTAHRGGCPGEYCPGIDCRARPDHPWGDPRPRHLPGKYADPAGAGSAGATIPTTVSAVVSAAASATARILFRQLTGDLECGTGLLRQTGATTRIGTARPQSLSGSPGSAFFSAV